MLGPFRRKPTLPPEIREVFAAALSHLETRVVKWKGVVAVCDRKGRDLEINTAEHLQVLDNTPAKTPPIGLAIYLATRLGLPLPESLALDLKTVRPWFRSRVLHRRVLDGPSRGMCRRPAFADPGAEAGPVDELITAVSIGGSRSTAFVTTRSLDEWGLSFEEVQMIGDENLKALLSPDDLRDVDGAEGVLAVIDSTQETGASACRVIDTLLPEIDPEIGVLFAVPADDTMLALPIRAGAGAKSLAALVQVTYAIAAERDEPLSEQVLWKRNGRVVRVPMTSVHEGGARRVHLEADGVVEDLLRLLGELE